MDVDGFAPSTTSDGNPIPSNIATLRLIRIPGTVPVGSSVVNMGQNNSAFAAWYVGDNGLLFGKFFARDFTVVTKPPVRSCTVTTKSISVSLSSAAGLPVKSFTGVGSTSPAIPFNLELDCSASQSDVYITLNGVLNPINSRTLSLTTESTATGVGVQILRNGLTYIFGSRAFLITARNNLVTIPLSARYIQTASNVTVGQANSAATVTLSYQ
ncbi:fimbrial protein [Herbaspirillum sp. LeCh32-8]|uniref:fimbrial protein n=1 Tax=Herbaspirillum sp. LeCh32-8 TaxID=2821356 RepID=UPI001AE7E0C2|nr:fimbrial protein [Herbaspirillum sp. LeCh32-8]MBP0598903.1 fimbrial protein [Herbaspirillum sp. LeCh32-8]